MAHEDKTKMYPWQLKGRERAARMAEQVNGRAQVLSSRPSIIQGDYLGSEGVTCCGLEVILSPKGSSTGPQCSDGKKLWEL